MRKKIFYVFIILAMILVSTCSNFVVAASIPRLAISVPSSGTVEVGGTITYTINIYNDATSVTLKPSDIRISGVTASISVQGVNNNQRTIVLSNIQGSVGSVGYISYIAGGVATNAKGGSKEMNVTSTPFTVVATVNPTPSTPSNNNQNQQTNNGNNNNYLPPSNNGVENNNNNNENNNEEENTEEKDTINPTMEIGNLSETTTQIGKDISFEIQYKDDKEMGEITLNKGDITLYGFKADVSITGDGNVRKVTLSNIQGNLGGLKYVKIASKTAKDKAGNEVKEDGKTSMFKVLDNDSKNKPDDWIENPNTGR